MNGSILGFSREEMERRFDDIAAFADIGSFLDQPVKLYSGGMFVRLAFAVTTYLDPDILSMEFHGPSSEAVRRYLLAEQRDNNAGRTSIPNFASAARGTN